MHNRSGVVQSVPQVARRLENRGPRRWECAESRGRLKAVAPRAKAWLAPGEPPASPEQARERERELGRFWGEHLRLVACTLRSAGTPSSELEDAVQRTFIIAARRQGDVRAGAERGFLRQTALNVAAHTRRSAARRREVPVSELPERIDAATPEQLTCQKRDRLRLERMLNQLLPELCTVFLLFELEELTMAEIAAKLQIPPGTVASRLRRARTTLRASVCARLGAGFPACAEERSRC